MYHKKSDYAMNKHSTDSIVYMTVHGCVHLTQADFAGEQEFQQWKSWSDADYYEQERRSRGYYDRCVSLEEPLSTCAVSSVEEMFFDRMAEEERAAAHQEQIAQIRKLLTNVQYRRLWLLYAECRNVAEIADMEGAARCSIADSLSSAV